MASPSKRRQESSWEFPAPCGWRAVRQAPGWGVRVIVSCVCAEPPTHTPAPRVGAGTLLRSVGPWGSCLVSQLPCHVTVRRAWTWVVAQAAASERPPA